MLKFMTRKRETLLSTQLSSRSMLSALLGLCLIAGGFAFMPRSSDATDPTVMTVVEQTNSTSQEIADLLAGPGVTVTDVLINGLAEPSTATKTSFGAFSSGLDAVGIDSGLIIGANQRASYFSASPLSTEHTDPDGRSFDASSPDGSIGKVLFDLASSAGLSREISSVNNVTELQFTVNPSSDFLKFEYVLAVTEVGDEVIQYPDGIGLFARTAGSEAGWSVQNNCAVIPTTGSYVAMETTGRVTTAQGGRATAQSNYDALVAPSLADGYVPNLDLKVSTSLTGANYIEPPGIAYESTVNKISFMTVPLTCVIDVSTQRAAEVAVEIAIAVADFNDGAVPPAVFLKGNSVRFSDSVAPVAAALDEPGPASLDPEILETSPETGGAVYLVDGTPALGMTLEPNQNATGLVLTGPDGDPFEMVIGAKTGPDGELLDLDGNGNVVFTVSKFVSVSGAGFKANTDVRVYMFSDPVLLGTLVTAGDGTFAGSLPVPESITPGDHTVQANGFRPDGSVRSVSLGVRVTSASVTFSGTGYNGPIVMSMIPGRAPTAGGAQVYLNGLRLDRTTGVFIGGIELEIISSRTNELIFLSPALAPGKHKVLIVSEDGTFTFDGLVISDAVVKTNLKSKTFISGFASFSSALEPTMRMQMAAFLAKFPDASLISCKGYTSGPIRLPADQKLANARSTSACDYVQQLKPDVEVRVLKGKTDYRLGGTYRKLRLRVVE